MIEISSPTTLIVGGEVAHDPNGLSKENAAHAIKAAMFHDLRSKGISFEEARQAAGFTEAEMPTPPILPPEK